MEVKLEPVDSPDFDCLDELDDIFDDENLFKDLEDLGEVLDELSNEIRDSQGEEGTASTFAIDVEAEFPELDKSPVKDPPVTVEEPEEGEITEFDEKNELAELRKRKSEIVNKMKKLVKHKIQLTNQRNDILLKLQSSNQLDKFNTLLQENSQLVKAISNQIFRMNPEIKKINEKIREVESSIGSADIDGEEQKPDSSALATISKKDIEDVEKFFNRHSESVKKRKDKSEETVSVKEREDKKFEDNKSKSSSIESRRSPMTRRLLSDESPRKFSSLEKSTVAAAEKPDAEKNSSSSDAPVFPIKTPKLLNDSNKLKMLFNRVCEMSEKDKPPSSSSKSSENTTTTTEIKREESRSPFSKRSNSIDLSETIDSKLKEIRLMKSFSNPDTNDSPLKSSTDNRRTISPIRLNKDVFNSDDRKRKTSSECDGEELQIKKSKKQESVPGRGLSKSLLQRLGSPPKKEARRNVTVPIVVDLGDPEVPENITENSVFREERKSFWCQYCNRAFTSTQTYVTHLESEKHIRTLMTKKKGTKISFYKDGDAPQEASATCDEGSAWYEGPKRDQVGNPAKPANSTSEGNVCIAVTGKDSFCTKSRMDSYHARCSTHAKCLVQNKDSPISYAPDLCSVCMEFLSHCHMSLKCCLRIFKNFKALKKRLGLNFDWQENPLKDWFFENYKKLQENSGSSPVSYEEFRAQQRNETESQEGVGSEMKEPTSKEDESLKEKDSGENPPLVQKTTEKEQSLSSKSARKNDPSDNSKKSSDNVTVNKAAPLDNPKNPDLHFLIEKMRNKSDVTAQRT